MSIRQIFILFLVSLLAGAGCAVVHTVPLSARWGDTIFVSVGSPNDPTTGNITSITYTPTGGSAIPIPSTNILSVFNLYPDKTSAAWLYSSASLIENESGHGPWTTVIALKVPDDGSIPVGAGSLQVNTVAANYPGTIPDTNGVDIALEILPGTGQASSFDYLGIGQVQLDSPLSDLEPMKRLRFQPSFTGYDGTNTYGAVEIKIGINKSGIPENDFNIVVDDKVGPSQTRNVHALWNAQRFETTVYFISPTGELQYSDVDFSIISTDLQNQFETGAQNVATDVTINSVTWYTVNGAVDSGGPPIQVVNLTGT